MMNKAHTTKKTGNFVRFFLFCLILTTVVFSCQKLDDATDDERDNLVGSWTCNESGQEYGQQNFLVTISKSTTDTTKILIDNFYGLGTGNKVSLKMNSLNLTIPGQTVDGNQISGSGSVSSNYNTINLSYTVVGGGTTDHVTAVFTKK